MHVYVYVHRYMYYGGVIITVKLSAGKNNAFIVLFENYFSYTCTCICTIHFYELGRVVKCVLHALTSGVHDREKGGA